MLGADQDALDAWERSIDMNHIFYVYLGHGIMRTSIDFAGIPAVLKIFVMGSLSANAGKSALNVPFCL